MRSLKTSKVKVIKNEGDFDRALNIGFAINQYECSPTEMWLEMPMHDDEMLALVEKHGFTPVEKT